MRERNGGGGRERGERERKKAVERGIDLSILIISRAM